MMKPVQFQIMNDLSTVIGRMVEYVVQYVNRRTVETNSFRRVIIDLFSQLSMLEIVCCLSEILI